MADPTCRSLGAHNVTLPAHPGVAERFSAHYSGIEALGAPRDYRAMNAQDYGSHRLQNAYANSLELVRRLEMKV